MFWILCFVLVAFYDHEKKNHPGKEPNGILDKTVITVLIYIASAIAGFGGAMLWVT